MAELVVNEKLNAIQCGLKERDGVIVGVWLRLMDTKLLSSSHGGTINGQRYLSLSELLFVCPSVGLSLYLAQGP